MVSAWRGETLVAVWPLMFVGIGWLRKLAGLGEPHSQYSTLIAHPELMDREVAAALKAALAQQRSCDVAVFSSVPKSSALNRLLRGHPPVAGYDNQSLLLDLSGFASAEAYTAQLGKLQKRNRNRRRNHLARLGPLDFAVIWPGHPDFDRLLRQCTAMKKLWLKRTGRYSAGFALAGHDDFLAGLPGDAEQLSGACLSVVRAGDRVIAAELGFIRNRHYYAYMGGFDWELRSHSPGKVQMEMTVGWLIDNGIAAYDLLGNPAEYKQSWSNRAVDLGAYAVPFSWKGRLYAGTWLPTLRPAAKRLYRAAPELMRRVLAFGQSVGCLLLTV